MTKFEIYTDQFEFRFGRTQASVPSMTGREVFDQYLQLTANDPTLRESFDDLEEAKAAFARTYANWGTTRAEASSVFWLLTGDVAYLEENHYDADGEYDQGGDVIEFSAESYISPDDGFCVLAEYRDLWSDDPDWDGTVTRQEIERLAREWGKTTEDLMEQVEEE